MSHVNYTPITLDVTATPIDTLVTTIYTWGILAPASSDYTDGEREIAFILKGNDRETNIYATNYTDDEGIEFVIAHHWDKEVIDVHVRYLVAELMGKDVNLSSNKVSDLIDILRDAQGWYDSDLDADRLRTATELLHFFLGV